MGISFNISTNGTFGTYKSNIINKMKNHENETSFQIGGSVYKQSEWEKMLDTFDKAQESVKNATRETEEERAEDDNIIDYDTLARHNK